MLLIHIFSHSYGNELLFKKMLQELYNNYAQEYGLLLINDGVYLLEILKKTQLLTKQAIKPNKFFVLEQDFLARGLKEVFAPLPSYINLINYQEFVELILYYSKNIIW